MKMEIYMPKHFKTNKRYLTDEEKLIEYFEDYMLDEPDFEFVYIDDPNYNDLSDEAYEYNDMICDRIDEAELNNNYEFADELRKKLIPIPERKIDIEKTFNLLPDLDKEAALIYIKNNLFVETIILKCLNCDYEEEIEYDIIAECWMDGPYPISYCPHCNIGDFIPLDVYNKKKKISN